MKTSLYAIVEALAKIHDKLLSLNDAYEYNFSDKQLHFLVIGIIGMALIFLVHPIFTMLAKKNHVMVISWIYVFTVIIVLTFAIEIGQQVTKSLRDRGGSGWILLSVCDFRCHTFPGQVCDRFV